MSAWNDGNGRNDRYGAYAGSSGTSEHAGDYSGIWSGTPGAFRRKKQNDQKQSAPAPFGLPLLMVVFLILCLFTFAAISLVTARNDYHASQKNAENQTAYYAACNQAEEKLAALNRELADQVSSGEKISADESTPSYEIPVDDSHVLSVALEADTDAETPHYTVLKWRVETSAAWEPEQTLPVLQLP